MYMAALQSMHEAIGSCKSNVDEATATAKLWDKSAALIIGHLEGQNKTGSTDGRLFWALSKKYCTEFGTCVEGGDLSSQVNEKISMLLYSGRAAVSVGGCDELRKATKQMSSLLLVPLFQALLSATVKLVRRNVFDKDVIQAEAYVYAQTLLPLIENVDKDSAQVLQSNFPLNGQAVGAGVVTVASALTGVMSDLSVDCVDVGANDEIDACTGRVVSSKKKRLTIAVGVILGALSLFGIIVILRSRRKTVKDEDSPIFIASKGELNHTSELLCSRTEESTSPRDSDEETDRLNDASDAIEDDPRHDDEAYIRAIENALSNERPQIV